MASYRQLHSRTPVSLDRSLNDEFQGIVKYSPPHSANSTSNKESTRKCLQEIRNQITQIDSNIKNSTAKLRSLNDKWKPKSENLTTSEKIKLYNANWGINTINGGSGNTREKSPTLDEGVFTSNSKGNNIEGTDKRRIRFADEENDDEMERRLIEINKSYVSNKEQEIKRANRNLSDMLEQLENYKAQEEENLRRKLIDMKEVHDKSLRDLEQKFLQEKQFLTNEYQNKLQKEKDNKEKRLRDKIDELNQELQEKNSFKNHSLFRDDSNNTPLISPIRETQSMDPSINLKFIKEEGVNSKRKIRDANLKLEQLKSSIENIKCSLYEKKKTRSFSKGRTGDKNDQLNSESGQRKLAFEAQASGVKYKTPLREGRDLWSESSSEDEEFYQKYKEFKEKYYIREKIREKQREGKPLK